MKSNQQLAYFNSLPMALCVFNQKDEILYCNNYFSQISRLSPRRCVGQLLKDIFPELDKDQLDKNKARLKAGLQKVDLSCSCFSSIIGDPGQSFVFQLSRHDNEERGEAEYIFTATEVSCFAEKLKACGDQLRQTRSSLKEEENSRKRLERSEKKLKALNKELYSIGYTISHDLRAPLRHIDGFSEILKDMIDEGDISGCKDFLERIQSSVGKMGDMLNAVLRLSRVMGAELLKQPFNISLVFREVWEEKSLAGETADIKFEIADDYKVNADADLLRILADNLIGNAIKYSQGRKNPRIEFGSINLEGNRVFYLKDNGRGFPAQEAEEIFLPFTRTCIDSGIEGNGIGLTIVKKIIESHSGSVWAEGEEGEGATFYFSLESDAIR